MLISADNWDEQERKYVRPTCVTVERSIVGFMGCQAAINALKLAHHIVRSDAGARVLVLNLELCTLHLQPSPEIEQLLCFLLFADGASAALVNIGAPFASSSRMICSRILRVKSSLVLASTTVRPHSAATRSTCSREWRTG